MSFEVHHGSATYTFEEAVQVQADQHGNLYVYGPGSKQLAVFASGSWTTTNLVGSRTTAKQKVVIA